MQRNIKRDRKADTIWKAGECNSNMKPETQTKEMLLKAAKEQFMEKGYMGASLRAICKEAGVTTGALYFFFRDKEDLFGALVKKPLDMMYEIMKKHYECEVKNAKNKTIRKHYENQIKNSKNTVTQVKNMADNKNVALMAVNCLYQYHDEFVLLLMKSQGSKYENCTDEFVAISEKHYRILSDAMSEEYGAKRIDDYTIHWISHLQIFSFVQLITHGLSQKEALIQMKTIVKFLINGWFGIYK